MSRVDASQGNGPTLAKPAAYARLRGVSRQAVSKLCRPGATLHAAGAVLADGRIVVELAERILGPAVPNPARASAEAAEQQGSGRAGPATNAAARASPPADAMPSGPALLLGNLGTSARILDDKARHERARADTAEMAARRERRELVLESAVADAQFDALRVVRNAVLAVPEARADELAAAADPRTLAAILLDALEDALRSAEAETARLLREAEGEEAGLDETLGGEGGSE